ncbi:Malate dehydrogenase 2 [Durusdinium trenchii]|uniref:Mitochondrial n=1 Tax=Durusdinium trenchii TaxID=1381693 RepID=A0ABP0ILA8_9DINO
MLKNGNRAGQYQGCFSKSHWGGRRMADKWNVFIKHAPNLSKRVMEVPNSLRPSLGIKVLKHTGGRYKSKPGEPLHRIPFQLAMAAETFLLDRMSLGEEIGYDFVESVIRQLLEIWNDKIEEFKSQVIEVVGPDVLAEQDKKIQAHVSDDEVAGIEEETANRINALVEALTPIDISHNFQALRLDTSSSLRADAWALTQLKKFGGGKLIMHAWMSRGLVTPEDMASWRFEGSRQALDECMKACRGSMRYLFQLDGIGEDNYDEEAKRITDARNTTLVGEQATGWAIIDQDLPGAEPILLPDWWNLPITRTLSIWQKESDDWQHKFLKRRNEGKTGLPPKAQENYDKWNQCDTRRLVLDKNRQSQVMNFSSKHLQQQKASCLLLEIRVSEQADQLRIRSGGAAIEDAAHDLQDDVMMDAAGALDDNEAVVNDSDEQQEDSVELDIDGWVMMDSDLEDEDFDEADQTTGLQQKTRVQAAYMRPEFVDLQKEFMKDPGCGVLHALGQNTLAEYGVREVGEAPNKLSSES